MSKNLTLSVSPHIHSGTSTSRIMGDVIIALLPTLIAGCVIFGLRSLLVVAVCVASCVGFEALFNLAAKKEQTVVDLSAAVTGLLLGLNLSANVPIWQCVIGSVFALYNSNQTPVTRGLVTIGDGGSRKGAKITKGIFCNNTISGRPVFNIGTNTRNHTGVFVPDYCARMPLLLIIVCQAPRMADQVFAPTMPSCFNPFAFWNFFTAASVFGPKSLSTVPQE